MYNKKKNAWKMSCVRLLPRALVTYYIDIGRVKAADEEDDTLTNSIY